MLRQTMKLTKKRSTIAIVFETLLIDHFLKQSDFSMSVLFDF